MSGFTAPPGGGLKLLLTASAAAVASVDLSSFIDGTYNAYLVSFSGVVPATDGALLFARVSRSGVFQSGATDYDWIVHGINVTPTELNEADASDSEMQLHGTRGQGSAAGETLNGVLWFFEPANTARRKQFIWDVVATSTTGELLMARGVGKFDKDNGAIDGIRFLFSTGNIASGEFALYGIKKQ